MANKEPVSKFQAMLKNAFAGAMTPALPVVAIYILIRGFSKDETAMGEGGIVIASLIPLTVMVAIGVLSGPMLGWWAIPAAIASTSILGAVTMVALSAHDSPSAA